MWSGRACSHSHATQTGLHLHRSVLDKTSVEQTLNQVLTELTSDPEKCVIWVPTPLSSGTVGMSWVSIQRPKEELLAYTTPGFLFHDKVQWKKFMFNSLSCNVGWEHLSNSGAVRVLNCNINFVKLKCTLLTSNSHTEQPPGQCTWKEGSNSSNTQNTRHLPVCQIHFWPFEFSREKVIFPHIWDATSWFLHQLICFFI